MDDVHSAHGTAGIVKHPLLVKVQVVRANGLLQISDDVIDDRARVFAMSLDGALGELVQVLGGEDVELVQARVEEAVDGGEEGEEDGEEAEGADGEAATARRLGAGGLGHDGWDWKEARNEI